MGRRAALVLAGGVFLGIALPPVAAVFRPYLLVGIGLPLVLSLLRIDWSELAAYRRRPGTIAALSLWLLVASPALAWVVMALVPLNTGVETAIILMAAAPPVMSAAAFALILGIDAVTALVATLAAMILVPLTLPPMALVLLGLDLDIGLYEFMFRLAAFVGGGFGIAWLVRRLVPPASLARNADRLDGLSVVGLLIFAIGIMDGVADALVADPVYVALVTALAFAANLALQVAGILVFLKLGRATAFSVGVMSGNCNMGMVLVVMADRADFDTVMYFALAQIPIYMLPAFLLPIYRLLLASAKA